jgi:hypothetical protein
VAVAVAVAVVVVVVGCACVCVCVCVWWWRACRSTMPQSEAPRPCVSPLSPLPATLLSFT